MGDAKRATGRRSWTIRVMGPRDVPDGLRLCRAAGWNQLEEDWRAMLDHGLFRVAVREGRVLGSAGALVYGRLAWVAMVLVEPQERRQGIGTGLVEDVVSLLGRVEVVGLDATPAGAAVYGRLGFADCGGLVRMERPAGAVTRAAAAPGLRHPVEADLETVGRWDRGVFGADRTLLLRWACRQAPEYAWVRVGARGLGGYVFGRHGHRTEHLGPLVAEDEDTAEALLAAVLAQSPARPFTIDAPERGSWIARLRGLGFEVQRPFRRMILGDGACPGDAAATFAVFGPELG